MLSYASKFPWKICNNPVSTNHEAVEYDKCDLWVHIKCSKINTQTYKNLEKESYSWYCIYCSAKIFPFSNVNEDNFHETIYGKGIKLLTITKKKWNQNEEILIEKLNDATDKEDLENFSFFFHVNELNKNFSKNGFNGTKFFHMNISSICRYFVDLQTLLAKVNVKCNIIGIR